MVFFRVKRKTEKPEQNWFNQWGKVKFS